MFRMFESFVGRNAWRGFIHGYLSAHAWGNASGGDFLGDAADRLGPDVAAALRTLLDQPGVPRISAVLRCEAGKPPRVELAQRRSLPVDVRASAATLWTVAVCLRYGTATANARQCTLLATATASLRSIPSAGVTRPRRSAAARAGFPQR